jgi:acetylcholinesterase
MANTSKEPLFHKAIMESGASTARAVYPYDHALHQKQFEEFIKETGSSHVSEDQIMSHLRSLPISTIVSASQSIFLKYDPSLRWAFQPVIEGPGGYIHKAPIAAWRSGDWHKMPILTGFNTNEGATFVPASMSKSSEFREFFRTLLPGLTESDLDAIDSFYPDPLTHPSSSPYVEIRRGLGAQFKRIEAAYAQFAYIAPVRHTAHFASSASLPQAPVYLYQFALQRSVNGGANHSDQRDFVTYSPDVVSFSKAQQEIAGKMHAYYTSFIAAGDPNAVKGRWPDRPHWPAYRAGEGERMVFGEGNTEWIGGQDKGTAANVVPDTYAQKECEFWWSKTDISEQKEKEKEKL